MRAHIDMGHRPEVPSGGRVARRPEGRHPPTVDGAIRRVLSASRSGSRCGAELRRGGARSTPTVHAVASRAGSEPSDEEPWCRGEFLAGRVRHELDAEDVDRNTSKA
jgi:hypothetical protein